jgi:hypothetical protein
MLWLQWKFVQFLWTANVVGSGLVLWRLYGLRIASIYRFFFASIALKGARSVILWNFGPRTHQYYVIWYFTEPLLWISYVLVVFELYTLVLKKYPGIYSLSRWFFFAAVATASIVTALTVMPTVGAEPSNSRQPLRYLYVLIERANNTSLAIFLLLLLVFVTWFSVPLSRNLLTHCSIYSGYFFVNNVIFLFWQARGQNAVALSNFLRLSIWVACTLCWVFLLSRAGEGRVASLRLGRSQLEERRLLGQLETLNATLLRTARK